MQNKKKKLLMYKDKPLIRVGNTIFYGDLGEKYILQLDIIETKNVKDIESATKVVLKLVDNSGELGSGQVFRQSEREDLYSALDIGEWWLQNALSQG